MSSASPSLACLILAGSGVVIVIVVHVGNILTNDEPMITEGKREGERGSLVAGIVPICPFLYLL